LAVNQRSTTMSHYHSEHLVIFTRYPQSGKAKTRMIPALGSEGAAQLQRQMTEHTLRQIGALVEGDRVSADHATSVGIWFSGGTSDLMREWLGLGWHYQPQPDGDLGMRMVAALQAAFDQGVERAVVIGTDCPGVDKRCLTEAFATLQQHDLVLGPATDGGYYLIGLRRLIPELFVGVPWSTADVLQTTLAIAHTLSLSTAQLEPLADVDYPADLPVWEAIQQQLISVIIPVLNEAASIEACLQQIDAADNVEVIVVDGGSQDDTVRRSQAWGVRVLTTDPGRAHQMNVGAQAAAGNLLLFLHADTRLPPNFAALVRQTLAQPNVSAGAFDLKIDDDTMPGLRWVEWGVKWRSRLLQLPYGDQAIFLTAATFRAVGGFPAIPIMEDFELVRRLRSRGRVAIAPATVLTSSRRWKKLGIWRTTVINQLTIAAYLLKLPLTRLAHWYRKS